MANVILEERSTEYSELHHGRYGEAILGVVGSTVEWIANILTLHVVLRDVQTSGDVCHFREIYWKSGASDVCLLHFCFATKTHGIPSGLRPFYMISLYAIRMIDIVRPDCVRQMSNSTPQAI